MICSQPFYEYDLGTGAQKNVANGQQPSGLMDLLQQSMNTGPDEKRLEKASFYANEALTLLRSYKGDDKNMADYLYTHFATRR